MRLYDTDGTTLIASAPCRAWGNRPGSIYLSATSAASLDIGSAYVVQLYGDFGSGISGNYTLTADDWRGINLVWLDEWVLNTAHSMQAYDGIDYTSDSQTDRGEILNAAGAGAFLLGIGMLNIVRPELFEVGINQLDMTASDFNPAMEEGQDWEATMGTEFVASMEATGNLLGIEAKYTASTIAAVIFILIVMVCALFSSAAFGVVLGLPIIAFGAWAGFISLSAMAVIIIGFALLFAWWFWWQPT